jgi:hypothetical protein
VTIECPYCAGRGDTKAVAAFQPAIEDFAVDEGAEPHSPDEVAIPYRATLLICDCCRHILLAYEEFEGLSDGDFREIWSAPTRVYPTEQVVEFPVQIPQGIRDSLEEARRSLKADSYFATAAMCRRVIEGICRHYNASRKLDKALGELRSRGIIDGILLQWAEALRLFGNVGAHPDPKAISKNDAADLFDFSVAICQYVFVLGEKFRKFAERTRLADQTGTTVQ